MLDSRVADLDQVAVDAMIDCSRGLAMTGSQKRAAINNVLLANRQLKNKPDGYWILDPSGAALEHFNLMQLSVEDVDFICAMADVWSVRLVYLGWLTLQRFLLQRLASHLATSSYVCVLKKIKTLILIAIRALNCTVTHCALCCGCRGSSTFQRYRRFLSKLKDEYV